MKIVKIIIFFFRYLVPNKSTLFFISLTIYPLCEITLLTVEYCLERLIFRRFFIRNEFLYFLFYRTKFQKNLCLPFSSIH